MSRTRHLSSVALGFTCALGVGLAAPAWAQADALLYERSYVIALNERCGLLDHPVANALEAGRMQARGVLARAGVDNADLQAFEAGAAKASETISCTSAEAMDRRDQASSAYEAWMRLGYMDFPARERGWTATRDSEDPFLVRQNAALNGGGHAAIGVVGDAHGSLALVVTGLDSRPSAARLIIRDPDALAEPADPLFTRLTKGPKAGALALQAAPDAYSRVMWAAKREISETGEVGFLFRADARAALEALDPREAFAVEIDAPAGSLGQDTQRIYFERGDLPTALAFARSG